MPVENGVQVLVRVCPTPNPEVDNEKSNILSIDESVGQIALDRKIKGISEFKFSGVLGPTASQADLYSKCQSILGTDLLNGINCCIMAYGQTGSGKTYSMYGKGYDDNDQMLSLNTTSLFEGSIELSSNPAMNSGSGSELVLGAAISSTSLLDSEHSGVAPRAILDLFQLLETFQVNSTAEKKFSYTVTCQLMQIYNEKIFDLLQDKRRENPLQIRDSSRGSSCSVYVKGLSSYPVDNVDDVMHLMKRGMKNRAIRSTEFNQESSRGHTILQLFIQVEEDDETGVRIMKRSTLSLVDLAGSEKWRLPPAAASGSSNSGGLYASQQAIEAQMKEMNNINTSLHVLGTCVSALVEPNRKHIPYRNSVLTRLLQDSLGNQNGRTIFIATVHEDPAFKEETYSTLQFASRALHIKMAVVPSSEVVGNITMEEARLQIAALRAKLKQYSEAVASSNATNASIISDGSMSRRFTSETPGNVDESGPTSGHALVCSGCERLALDVSVLTREIRELRAENERLVALVAQYQSSPRSPRAKSSNGFGESDYDIKSRGGSGAPMETTSGPIIFTPSPRGVRSVVSPNTAGSRAIAEAVLDSYLQNTRNNNRDDAEGHDESSCSSENENSNDDEDEVDDNAPVTPERSPSNATNEQSSREIETVLGLSSIVIDRLPPQPTSKSAQLHMDQSNVALDDTFRKRSTVSTGSAIVDEDLQMVSVENSPSTAGMGASGSPSNSLAPLAATSSRHITVGSIVNLGLDSLTATAADNLPKENESLQSPSVSSMKSLRKRILSGRSAANTQSSNSDGPAPDNGQNVAVLEGESGRLTKEQQSPEEWYEQFRSQYGLQSQIAKQPQSQSPAQHTASNVSKSTVISGIGSGTSAAIHDNNGLGVVPSCNSSSGIPSSDTQIASIVQNLAAVSPMVPRSVPLTSTVSTMSCSKHGLAQCILCAMLGNDRPPHAPLSTVTSTWSNSSVGSASHYSKHLTGHSIVSHRVSDLDPVNSRGDQQTAASTGFDPRYQASSKPDLIPMPGEIVLDLELVQSSVPGEASISPASSISSVSSFTAVQSTTSKYQSRFQLQQPYSSGGALENSSYRRNRHQSGGAASTTPGAAQSPAASINTRKMLSSLNEEECISHGLSKCLLCAMTSGGGGGLSSVRSLSGNNSVASSIDFSVGRQPRLQALPESMPFIASTRHGDGESRFAFPIADSDVTSDSIVKRADGGSMSAELSTLIVRSPSKVHQDQTPKSDPPVVSNFHAAAGTHPIYEPSSGPNQIKADNPMPISTSTYQSTNSVENVFDASITSTAKAHADTNSNAKVRRPIAEYDPAQEIALLFGKSKHSSIIDSEVSYKAPVHVDNRRFADDALGDTSRGHFAPGPSGRYTNYRQSDQSPSYHSSPAHHQIPPPTHIDDGEEDNEDDANDGDVDGEDTYEDDAGAALATNLLESVERGNDRVPPKKAKKVKKKKKAKTSIQTLLQQQQQQPRLQQQQHNNAHARVQHAASSLPKLQTQAQQQQQHQQASRVTAASGLAAAEKIYGASSSSTSTRANAPTSATRRK